VDGDIVGEFRLPLMGRHNLFNLQAALAAARALDVPLVEVLPHVATFRGVGRRLQAMGSVAEGPAAGALVIDDFAHHPEELLASAAAVRGRFPGRRVVAVYQPHQVSRTEALLEGFAEALGVFDEVLLCDIFVARDRHPERAEASCERLVAAVRPPVARRVGPAREARSAVLSALRPDDVCLVMGAGDIDELAPDLARTAARP
jgi:UDP-N-acetylmuramate--alanine ligase